MKDTRICVECGKGIEHKRRRVVCSDRCARARQDKQLAAYVETKRVEREGKPKREKICAVCLRSFVPTSNNQVYCIEVECRDEGLRRAVGRQRERRQLAATRRSFVDKEAS